MNKKYIVLVKLVFLIFIILIMIGIVWGGAKVKTINADAGGGSLPIKTIDTPITIQGNQFWDSDFDYKILATVTIPASSSLMIGSGAEIEISNNASFNVNGGVLNIGFATSSFGFLSVVNSSSSLIIDLNSVDSLTASSATASTTEQNTGTSTVGNTKINISGVGYNNVFSVNNGGVLNIRTADISGSGGDLERTVFGVYKKSKLNIFESNINNIEVKGTQAFYAYDNSRIILYKNNINGFIGGAMGNIFNSSSLNVLRTKIIDAKVDTAINVFSQGLLNFQKSSISSVPLKSADSSSGTCIGGYNGAVIHVSDSDIGPCFIALNFDGTGDFKVNKNNISGNGDSVLNFSGSVDLKNNWWGRTEGPKQTDLSTLDPNGNYSTAEYINVVRGQNGVEDYSNGVLATPFSPVPFGQAEPCCSSVLFIPGIQGSRLYKKGLLGMENQLWEPNRNKDVESLFLNSNGASTDSSIYTKDIIAKTNFFGPIGATDIYQSLIDLLVKEKADGNISDFETLAYDWRFLPSNILSSGIKTDSSTEMLKDKIKDMAKKSPSGKVIIIAHSYGGLLAKSLLEDLEKEGQEGLIESIALVSVPEYGTPQAIPSLFYGDNEDLLGGLILSKKTAVALGKNMASAHLLLPSSSYFTESDGIYNQKNLIGFDSWVVSKYKLDGLGGSGGIVAGAGGGGPKIDSFPQMVDFLKNKNIVSASGINSAVFDKARAEHDLIDNYSANLSAKTYSILAVGLPTLSSMTYVKPKCRGFFFCSPNNLGLPDFTRKYSLMGDGVVIAHNLGKRTGSVFTVDIGKENEVKKTAPAYYREDPIAHKDVFRSSGVKDILHAILSRSKSASQAVNSFGLLSNPYVSYVSGSLSKPGPILGSYGNSSILTGITKIKDDATDSDFVQRFNNSKVLVAEAYGPLTLQTSYQNITDLQNKAFEQLNLDNRIVNYTNYSDGNRTGVVYAVQNAGGGTVGSGGTGGGPGGGGLGVGNSPTIFGQGSGVGTAQIVTKIDNTEIIYPTISVTPATSVDIDSSTTTIAIDNNSDGKTDKTIIPIAINTGTSTEPLSATSTEESVEDLFTKARLQISSASSSASSTYLSNKYIDKLNIAERKYQKSGILQALSLLKTFYDTIELNMNTISNLIIVYNKQQGFYSLNNFLLTNKKVLALTVRQKEIRDEILFYIDAHDAYSALIQKLGEGL